MLCLFLCLLQSCFLATVMLRLCVFGHIFYNVLIGQVVFVKPHYGRYTIYLSTQKATQNNQGVLNFFDKLNRV